MTPVADADGVTGRGWQIVAEHWTLQILFQAFTGSVRFRDLRHRLGVSDPVLAQRLRDLVADGVLDAHVYSLRPRRSEYRLTDQGRDLWPVLLAIWVWETRWDRPFTAALTPLVHLGCGQPTAPRFGCGRCGRIGVTHRDTEARRRPGSFFSRSVPERRHRRAVRPVEASDRPAIVDLIGDRWTIAVLGSAMLGLRRFTEIQRELAISPFLLAERLDTLVDAEALIRVPIAEGARRKEYRLLAKGHDLLPVFVAINEWSHRWHPEVGGRALRIVHRDCGEALAPAWWCDRCDQRLSPDDLGPAPSPR